MKSKSRKKCLSCGNKKLNEVINLGLHSYADRFISKKFFNKKDPLFPLIVQLCKKCKFLQLKIITPPKDRYLNFDYSYTSSNSSYSKNHWNEFSKDLIKKYNVSGKKIIEMGSNDGYLTNLLKNKGAEVLCVDASKVMTKIAMKTKLNAICSVFNYKESVKIKKQFGEADIIIANNVFNHANEPADFIKGVKNLLKDKKSVFIFEQPDFTSGALTNKFDQIYHEHVSYFTATNINNFMINNKLFIKSIDKNEYHGGSLRTAVSLTSNKSINSNLKKFIKFEKNSKIYLSQFYKQMMNSILKQKKDILIKIKNLIEKGYIISGVGAGAKSNTFLTFNGLDNDFINFITDSSPHKLNKRTPFTRIPIKSDKELGKHKKIACIILVWNISKMITNKLKYINKNIYFIKT